MNQRLAQVWECLLPKSLTVGSTTKLATLFPAIERRADIGRSVEKWGQEHIAAVRVNIDT
jgi:hypothetical protein